MDHFDDYIQASFPEGKLLLHLDGRQLGDPVCELCMLLAGSSSAELPCMIFAKPFFPQLRWSTLGRVELVTSDKARLPTWPMVVFQPVDIDASTPVLLSPHLFAIETLVAQSLAGFDLCEDLKLLLSADLVQMKTVHSLLMISIHDDLKSKIQVSVDEAEWLTAATQLWKLCLQCIPDPYAEPLWQAQYELLRPVMATDVLPLLAILGPEQVQEVMSADIQALTPEEIVRAISAYVAASMPEIVSVHEFVCSSFIAQPQSVSQNIWRQFLRFLEATTELLSVSQAVDVSLKDTALGEGSSESIFECVELLTMIQYPYGRLTILDWYLKLDSIIRPNYASYIKRALVDSLPEMYHDKKEYDELDAIFDAMLSGVERAMKPDSSLTRALSNDPHLRIQEPMQVIRNISAILSVSFYRSSVRDFSSASIGLYFIRDFFQEHLYPGFHLWLVTTCELMQCLNALGRELDAQSLVSSTISMVQNDSVVHRLRNVRTRFVSRYSQLQNIAQTDDFRQGQMFDHTTDSSEHDRIGISDSGSPNLELPANKDIGGLQATCTEANFEPFTCFIILLSDSYAGRADYSSAERILKPILNQQVAQRQYHLLAAVRLSKVMRRQNYSPQEDPRYLKVMVTIIEYLSNAPSPSISFCLDELDNIAAEIADGTSDDSMLPAPDEKLLDIVRKYENEDFRMEKLTHLLRAQGGRGTMAVPTLPNRRSISYSAHPGFDETELDHVARQDDSVTSSPEQTQIRTQLDPSETSTKNTTASAPLPASLLSVEQRATAKTALFEFAYGTRIALSHFAGVGNLEVVLLCLEEMANDHGNEEYVRIALWRAAKRGHEKVVEALLDYGINVDILGIRDATALHVAASGGHTEVVRTLLEYGADVDILDTHDRTPLHIAASKGHAPVVRTLLDYSASIDQAGFNGSTPLHEAVLGRHEHVVRVLIDYGAKVDEMGTIGRTPLQRAAEGGNIKIIHVLLDRGASVDLPGKNGWTPLHEAAASGHDDAIQTLLDCGATIDKTDTGGRTPLHTAAISGRKAVIRILLDRGADTSLLTKVGYTAYDLAMMNGHMEIVEESMQGGELSTLRSQLPPKVPPLPKGNRKGFLSILRRT